MYSLQQVMAGLKQPGLIAARLNRLYHRRLGRYEFNPEGTDVLSEEWDNLVILDACRYDTFESRSALSGTLEPRVSRGSATREFVRANFAGKELGDLVYVDANGYFARLRDEIDVTVHEYIYVENETANGLTADPAKVTTVALDAAERFPDKRLLVHYMQPHAPFIGPEGEKFEDVKGFTATVQINDVTDEEIRAAYRENLDIALEEVERLLSSLGGLSVVTADHGELLGERQRPIPLSLYGHPVGVYMDELVTVPWHTSRNGDRRQVSSEAPSEDERPVDIESINEKLQSLGYKT